MLQAITLQTYFSYLEKKKKKSAWMLVYSSECLPAVHLVSHITGNTYVLLHTIVYCVSAIALLSLHR